MLVDNVVRTPVADGWRLSATVRTASWPEGRQLYFTVRGGDRDWLPVRGDAFFAALVMPAMALGEDLTVAAPVSPRLLRSAQTAMEIYHAWWGARLRPVRFAVAEEAPAEASADGVGLFFSTGVDCFYSLLKDRDRHGRPGHRPVDALVHANFDRHRGADYDRLVSRVRRVAAESGCAAVVVETDVRAATAELVHWEEFHGAALAAVALALQGLLGRCLIAASDQYSRLPPLGSHPLLDHLWSTEGLEIVHDGAEATRTDKVERHLADSPLVWENLGVCWLSRPAHNCGICEKCLRTMAAFDMAGSLRHCRTLPTVLDLDRLRTAPLRSEGAMESMRSLAEDATARGRRDIAEAADHAHRSAAQRLYQGAVR
ncbi:hypothetical protein [Kitasatospora griseola]|uniref:hypothetical protein n=1 Tax=Kitasatospora griseola TaxID=2064 RepID=UPI00069711A0|nr:hypothetical protein [Kitasatospora griseola]